LAIGGLEWSKADVEDIFQEVFLTILQGDKLLQLKNTKFLPGWLSMVASNKTIDFMRQKVRWRQNLVFERPAFGDCDFKQELFNRDTLAITKKIIDALSNREKIIISLNLLEGRTHKEVADITGIPVNTVSTLVARTKKKLKIELEKRGIEGSF